MKKILDLIFRGIIAVAIPLTIFGFLRFFVSPVYVFLTQKQLFNQFIFLFLLTATLEEGSKYFALRIFNDSPKDQWMEQIFFIALIFAILEIVWYYFTNPTFQMLFLFILSLRLLLPTLIHIVSSLTLVHFVLKKKYLFAVLLPILIHGGFNFIMVALL